MDRASRSGDRLAAVALVLIATIQVGLLGWTVAPAPEFLWRLAPWLATFGAVFVGLAIGVWRGWRGVNVLAMGIAGAWALVAAWSVLMRLHAIDDPGSEAYVAREFGAAAAMIALALFAIVRLARTERGA